MPPDLPFLADPGMLRPVGDGRRGLSTILRKALSPFATVAENCRMTERPRPVPPVEPVRNRPDDEPRAPSPPPTDPRRALPRVDALLDHPAMAATIDRWGRAPVLDELAGRIAGELDALAGRRVRAVVNATGVVLHTNLGRAPLSAAALAAVA